MNAILTTSLLAIPRASLNATLAGLDGGGPDPQAGPAYSSLAIRWLIAGALIVGAFLVARLLQVGLRRWRISPAGLFFSLCRVHKLRWSDRWLLWHVARYYRMADPARVFVEPERFEPQAFPPHLAGRAARLMEIGESLFYAPPPPKEKTSAFTPPVEPASPPPATPLFVPDGHPTLELNRGRPTGPAGGLGGA